MTAKRPARVVYVGAAITATVSVCLLVGLLAEAAVRARAIWKYGFVWAEDLYVTDQTSGLRVPKPHGQFGGITFNSLGFRGPELQQPKPPGTIRLAFLGASTTICAEIADNDKTWPHLVYQELQTKYPDVRFDYVNGGVSGYGVADSLKNLRYRIAQLEPDIIVIYHAANDFSYNAFVQAKSQGLVTERPDQDKPWLAHYSLLAHLVHLNLSIRRNQRVAARQLGGTLRIDLKELVRPFRRDLDELLAAAKQTGGLVAIATFATHYRRSQSHDEQIAAAATSLYYSPYMTLDGLMVGFDAYNEAIRHAAHEAGALLIAEENSIPGDSVHFVDSVHFTEAGAVAMARRVSAALLRSVEFETIVIAHDNKNALQSTSN